MSEDEQVRKNQDDTEEFPVTAAPVDSGEVTDEVEDEYLPQARKRLGKSTIALVALVLLGGGFLIGVAVQKNRPATATTSRAGTGRGNFAAFAAAGGFGGTAPNATSGTGAASAGTGSAATSDTPAVIGTIASVSGNSIVVKNFAGKSITVKLTDSTSVTKAVPTSALKSGDTVSVVGSTGSDGKVTATKVSAK